MTPFIVNVNPRVPLVFMPRLSPCHAIFLFLPTFRVVRLVISTCFDPSLATERERQMSRNELQKNLFLV